MAAPLPTAARSVIPKDAQQIISIDYRSLKSSPTALVLRDRVLPAKMKEFEATMGEDFKPAALLEKVAAEGKRFQDL